MLIKTYFNISTNKGKTTMKNSIFTSSINKKSLLGAAMTVGLAMSAAAPAVAACGAYNPCRAKSTYSKYNPCGARKQNPCAAKKLNPCAAQNPYAAKKPNPCAAQNPCAAYNPCAAKNVSRY